MANREQLLAAKLGQIVGMVGRRNVSAGMYALPHLFGASGAAASAYCDRIFECPLMQEWTDGAQAEPNEIVELEVEF